MMWPQKKAVIHLFVSALRKVSLFLMLIIYSASTLAHVKWFVEDDSQFRHFYYPIDLFSISIISITLLFLLVASLLDRMTRFNVRLNRLLYGSLLPQRINTSGDWINALLKQSIAIMLLANLLQGHFVAPHFVHNGGAYIYSVLQFLLILILIFNVNLFSISLILFSIYLVATFPIESSIDYVLELMAIGFALFFTDKTRRSHKYIIKFSTLQYSAPSSDLGLMLLRIGLGMQLIVLSFHDKLLNPGYGLVFLVEYPYFNFLRYFGWEAFSDLYFLLGAGMVELSLGILLVANIVPRLSSLLIFLIFLLTGFVMGIEELAGHIPIIVAAGVIIFGISQKPVFVLDKEQSELLVE